MMTHLEKFVDLYKQFEIELKPFEKNGKICIELGYGSENSSESLKFDGYTGFYSLVEFTENGEFIAQYFYE